MVRITDGRVQLVVPTSAFRDVYSHNGFHICEDVVDAAEASVAEPIEKYSNGSATAEAPAGPTEKDEDDALNIPAEAEEESTTELAAVDGEHDAEDEGTASEDEKFLDVLFLKPIEQWSKKEIKRVAQIKGINLSGTNSIQEARELLKSELLS